MNKSPLCGTGRTIYDDGVARSADLGQDRYLLECSGFAVASPALDVVDAAASLIGKAGGKLSVLEATRAVLEHLAEGLPADG